MLPLNGGYIYISNEIEDSFEKIKEFYKPKRVVGFIKEKFLIEDAKEVIAEAYLSEKELKYIVIGAKEFNVYSQNTLLKILEEPPSNVAFIMISPSKSALLPTIRSRLAVYKDKKEKNFKEVNIDFSKLNYEEMFDFLKNQTSISKQEAKELLEAVYHKAVIKDKIKLNENILENFDMAFRALELNARFQNIMMLILMGILYED
jgi:DNA polymerase-3 subunit delta'